MEPEELTSCLGQHGPMFGPILRTELRQQGLKVGDVEVDSVDSPSLTTRAFLSKMLVYAACAAGFVAAGVIAFSIFELKQKAAENKDLGDVEVQDIKGEDGENAAISYGSTAAEDADDIDDSGTTEENSGLLK